MLSRTVFVAALLAFAVPSFAAEEEEEAGPWAGKVYLGYLASSGNTETSSLNTGFEVSYATGKWAHKLEGKAINASENDVTTAESYDLGWKSERNFSEKDFLFGQIWGRKNLFSGYETQVSEVLGYGRRIVDTDVHKLNGELGVGARQSDLIGGSSENETIFSAGFDYKWQFSDTANFTQTLAIEYGDANTYMESVTAISAKLVGNLALVASYTMKKNTDVPPDIEKTDTYTALSLEYLF
jgi:putative salt-induced outer membrane protein